MARKPRGEDDDEEQGSRLFVVANRLPISIKQRDDGGFDFGASAGGLASSLSGLASKTKFVWYGWPGIEVHRNDKEHLRQELERQHSAVPVFLSQELAEKHYNGFSNSILWPLLHRMPDKADSHPEWSDAYKEVNEIFAENLIPQLEDGDKVWIHDYHLLLLPSAIRRRLRNKKIKIGFFLHTPFPSEDFFSILPFREAICEGVFNSDVVGFHTRGYVEDFLDSAEKVLPGVRRSPHDLHYRDRTVIVHQFPIGIDPSRFRKALSTPEVQSELTSLTKTYADKTVLLGIDRLDYTKGVPQKLLAFDNFLKDNPSYVGKVVMIQVAVPTRPGVTEYVKLQHQVEQLVGRVNGNHSTASYTPVVYLHRSIPFEHLCALYALADICVVSPIRDGLNLVSYEYTICQAHKAATQACTGHHKEPGVLMLSQYTGAATTLRDSVIINPWDTPRFSEAIHMALHMPPPERKRRHESNVKVVEEQTSVRWGQKFLYCMETMQVDDEVEQPNDLQVRSHSQDERDRGQSDKGVDGTAEDGVDGSTLSETESRRLESVASAGAKDNPDASGPQLTSLSFKRLSQDSAARSKDRPSFDGNLDA
ncbi:alpha,alpha-trehalose-phosphate synthase (UDP-forming) [Cyphellophora europaea CBS 101466]|uniref:Alpha,alpha-trehalose-phosphate synthase (UDP-forming) n=1 Tax=Cyphellophora europaea (strain CBS 101466) TaxID=1220924 RepID=W2RLE6_CYPE1|nr:alpha,alpha-trehalose-phosphate synthase (UDP-forming) [Cyphellophora europaea CBS 101466]ETN36528.1 alpha,alpha-trehalose-phosphate synthase (UDP-forming) [Cyphellophora europaea CBS 101466]